MSSNTTNSSTTCVDHTSNSEVKSQKKKVSQWSKDEDERLIISVKQNGPENWGTIAQDVKNRTRKQCRERYLNCLCESLSKEPWTAEEDTLLIKLQKEFGNKWTKISACLKGRSPNSVKNRFCAHIAMIPKRSQNNKENALKKKLIIVCKESAFVPAPSWSFSIM
ncbi:transcription factor MYB90, putative [Entamoeba invadens IP1]|uniref:transcription factor MYB90, putative n=1 Tax=Entamoeba invadens IP1 TaxID=370355 RepID=UPI0002C3FB8D|nr:transcription factor MYB90, putative [Entamoeba invadens IP1]ELP90630.1 transcription factor MYB90, putative [Entamoeba invadens IP1]|eukprot:XP_004257401.1 transcription factor MYB90, putative [Entamoeba invadens IP1]